MQEIAYLRLGCSMAASSPELRHHQRVRHEGVHILPLHSEKVHAFPSEHRKELTKNDIESMNGSFPIRCPR